MREHDTIAAPATPPTPAARAIVRTSGPRAFELLATLADGIRPAHASAVAQTVTLAPDIAIPATIYAFVGPRSSTGEDVVEYHLPGSPLFVRLLLARLFERGARLAEPGEFTARAFFNGRLDLAQAEGVAATISAADRAGLKASRQLLAGGLGRRVVPISDSLVNALATVEATLDFSDEPIDGPDDRRVAAMLQAADAALASLAAGAARIGRLAHEPRIVLVGRPNAGKSTLLNALAGHERAIASDVPGTTRDAISTQVSLRRGVAIVVDTAGVNADDAAVDDGIVGQARDASLAERRGADILVQAIALDDPAPIDPAADLVVWTKSDVALASVGSVAVSARTGEGMANLRECLDAIAFGAGAAGDGIGLNARHVEAIGDARHALREAREAVAAGPEFVAAAIRRSIDALGSIVGVTSPDDVLGRIFRSFCIGK